MPFLLLTEVSSGFHQIDHRSMEELEASENSQATRTRQSSKNKREKARRQR